MKKIICFIAILFAFKVEAADLTKDCFKFGEQWHDIVLPDNMKNVRWLFGDNKNQTPFMSVTFDADDASIESWTRMCGVNFQKVSKQLLWGKDIQLSTLGAFTVIKYKNNRYCIGVERTVRGEEKSVNGKPYLGCPEEGLIDY